MPRVVYIWVRAGVLKVEDFSKEKKNCAGNPSAATIQKMARALGQLSFGTSADGFVEMLKTFK